MTKTNGKKKKKKKVPAKYEAGFLVRMDGRTELAKVLSSAYQEVTDDMGGMENLSHTQLALAERFIFLEHVLRKLEYRIATSPKANAKLLSRWIQGLNSFTGLAKTIGLERRARKVECLESYVVKRKKKNNGKAKRK